MRHGTVSPAGERRDRDPAGREQGALPDDEVRGQVHRLPTCAQRRHVRPDRFEQVAQGRTFAAREASHLLDSMAERIGPTAAGRMAL